MIIETIGIAPPSRFEYAFEDPFEKQFGELSLNLSIQLTGIASVEAFGTLELHQKIELTGIPSAGAIGSLNVVQTIQPVAISGAEAFGTLELHQKIELTGIPSAGAFGEVVPDPFVDIVVIGIASSETFGALNVVQTIQPVAISSAEALGDLEIRQTIQLTGIVSAEAFGEVVPDPFVDIVITGIVSTEAFGTTNVIRVIKVTGGIASGEAFGKPKLRRTYQPLSENYFPIRAPRSKKVPIGYRTFLPSTTFYQIERTKTKDIVQSWKIRGRKEAPADDIVVEPNQ